VVADEHTREPKRERVSIERLTDHRGIVGEEAACTGLDGIAEVEEGMAALLGWRLDRCVDRGGSVATSRRQEFYGVVPQVVYTCSTMASCISLWGEGVCKTTLYRRSFCIQVSPVRTDDTPCSCSVHRCRSPDYFVLCHPVYAKLPPI